MHSKVVHCKREEFDVYIGRPGPWGNPYSHKSGTRAQHQVASVDEAIAKYRSELWFAIEIEDVTLEELAALHGKTLGCWCAPGPCHGDVLVKAAAWAHEQLQEV